MSQKAHFSRKTKTNPPTSVSAIGFSSTLSTVFDAKYAEASEGRAARPPAAAENPNDFATDDPPVVAGFTMVDGFGLAFGSFTRSAISECV
jgi:hypothetical protein